MLWAKPKSALYRECLPVLNSGRIELLDHPPTRRVIDGETREPYWPSATGFDADPLHDRDYDDLRSEFRRNGW